MPTSRTKATLYTYAGSAGNSLMVALQGILLIPLCIHYIPIKLYGAWIATGEILVLFQVFDLGIPNLMIQKIGAACGRSDDLEAGQWFGTGTILLLAVSIAVAVAGGLLATAIMHRLVEDPIYFKQFHAALMIATLATAGVIFNYTFIGVSQGVQKTGLISLFTVAGSLTNLLVSILLLMHGYQLYAIGFGYLARTTVLLLGSGVFILCQLPEQIKKKISFSKDVYRLMMKSMPITAFGGVSFIVMNQGEMFLISTFLRPELAPIMLVTRKAAELVRSLVELLGMAAYGSFSHLIGAGEKARASEICSKIFGLRNYLSYLMFLVYIGCNQALVSRWVGHAFFAGLPLTCMIGIQFFLVGMVYFLNLIYRSTGHVEGGAGLFVLECLVRVPLAILLLKLLGLPGIPLAAMATSLPMLLLLHRKINRTGRITVNVWGTLSPRTWFALLGSAVLTLVLALRIHPGGWAGLFGTALAAGLLLTGGLYLMSSDFRETVAWIKGITRVVLGRGPA